MSDISLGERGKERGRERGKVRGRGEALNKREMMRKGKGTLKRGADKEERGKWKESA